MARLEQALHNEIVQENNRKLSRDLIYKLNYSQSSPWHTREGDLGSAEIKFDISTGNILNMNFSRDRFLNSSGSVLIIVDIRGHIRVEKGDSHINVTKAIELYNQIIDAAMASLNNNTDSNNIVILIRKELTPTLTMAPVTGEEANNEARKKLRQNVTNIISRNFSTIYPVEINDPYERDRILEGGVNNFLERVSVRRIYRFDDLASRNLS